jgi:hypothetical protein
MNKNTLILPQSANIRRNLIVIILFACLAEGYAKVPGTSKEILNRCENIPLFFIANEGQTDANVAFISKGNHCTMFFTPEGTLFSLTENQSNPTNGFALRLNFLNSNTSPEMVGEEKLSSTTNYFLGNNPSLWKTNVSNFGKVRLNELYKGIDLVYYGNQSRLEYDFMIKPGTNPSKIRLSYDLGNKKGNALSINEQGDLIISTPIGNIIEHKPYCYQYIDGKKQRVDGKYQVIDAGKNIFSFSVGNYDKNHTLVIDPVIEYSTYLGGNGDDLNFGVVRDNAGNIYLSGNTSSGDFPTTTGVYSSKSKGDLESFITKLDPTCTKIIYSTFIGGDNADYGGNLAIDAKGNAYLTGSTHSWDFPVTKNALVKEFKGPWSAQRPDIFIIKLSSNGDSLLYSTFFGGSKVDMNSIIYADGMGNAYITLYTESSKLPEAPSSFNKKYAGKGDAYIMKLDPAGNLIYSSYLGGKQKEVPTCIIADKEGNAVIAGTTNSPDFQRSVLTFDTAYHGKDDIFVTKISGDGSKILFSSIMGGKENEMPKTLKLDNEGNICLAGFTESSDFPVTKNTYENAFHGKRDAFFSKISASVDKLIYSTLLGGNKYDCANSMELGQSGDIYLAGTTNSIDFPTTANAFDKTYNGSYYDYGAENSDGGDIFICQLDINNSKLNYSTYFGGTGNEDLPQLIVKNTNDLMIVGQTNSPDLPVTTNAINKTKKGRTDIFISRLNLNTPLSNNIAPQLTNPIADYKATFNQVFKINIPENVFTDKDNFEVLPLQLTLSNGEPLPGWMSYVPKTRTLIGLPPQIGKWEIKISVLDNQKAGVNARFQINVEDPRKDKKAIDLDYGLVAYYPFNGDTKDAGKNGYHGQIKRAWLCDDRNGKPNSAYCFNGSDNYIQCDSVKSLEEIDAITVSAWINPQSIENYASWFSKAASENNSQIRTGFGLESGKKWGLTVFNEGWAEYNTTDNQIPSDQWSFVVITANNITGEAKAYLNGKEVGSWQNIKKFAKSKYPMYIGLQVDDNIYFDGKIDEVRVYNRILSTDEITSLYNLK